GSGGEGGACRPGHHRRRSATSTAARAGRRIPAPAGIVTELGRLAFNVARPPAVPAGDA
ncbi:MAG: hypothetical protein H0T75_11465, partial [Rhizobiales bacterium]|nr:hypothetical protein [Hyphomicrobiales bacterium]